MTLLRADIETIVVGQGPVSSLMVLKVRPEKEEGVAPKAQISRRTQPLPIRIGSAEAAGIGMLLQNQKNRRPMTFDLMGEILDVLEIRVDSSDIARVEGATFFARINLARKDGTIISLDARPSDAIALALKKHAPIFVDEKVLETASLPDFDKVKRQQDQVNMQEFQQFVQTIHPEDFQKS